MNHSPARLAHFQQELDRFILMLRDSNSATAMLAQWMNISCADHAAEIVAVERSVGYRAASDIGRLARLQVQAEDAIQYRRVWLMYKGRIVSDAENWYVPARLSPDMRRQLTQSAIPFGTVIGPLAPTRETLSSERLWPGPVQSSTGRLPAHVLRHRALVRNADGCPVSEVQELYTRNILLGERCCQAGLTLPTGQAVYGYRR